MRLKIVANLGLREFPETPWKNGEVREVKDENLARVLLARGLAKEAKDAPVDDKPGSPKK